VFTGLQQILAHVMESIVLNLSS